MAYGVLTSRLAWTLQGELAPQGLEVLCSHGPNGAEARGRLGKVRAWYGPAYTQQSILADLDIAVVSHTSGRLIALVEVEETSAKPKLLVGDVLATLLGDRISFRGTQHWAVGPWTSLIVLAKVKTPADCERIAFVAQQVNLLSRHLTTPNAAVGCVVMEGFVDEAELGDKLRQHIHTAMARAGHADAASQAAGP